MTTEMARELADAEGRDAYRPRTISDHDIMVASWYLAALMCRQPFDDGMVARDELDVLIQDALKASFAATARQPSETNESYRDRIGAFLREAPTAKGAHLLADVLDEIRELEQAEA